MNHYFIIPSWTPFYALNWVTKYAISSEYNGANYLFFETLDGYKFKSLESYMDVQDEDVYATYYNIPPRTSVTFDDDYFLIRELRVKKNFNIMQNIIDGMYSNRMITHDIIKRTKEIVDFDYKDSYSDFKHVEYNKRPSGQTSTMLLPESIESDFIDYSENPDSNNQNKKPLLNLSERKKLQFLHQK